MNTIFWLSFFLLLVLATYASAVTMALLMVSRSGLEARLAETDRGAEGEWLYAHLDTTRLSVSLLRTVLRMGFFVIVLVAVVGLGKDAWLTSGSLAVAGGITVACLWIFTMVFASALARHATVGLITGALPALKGLEIACWPLTRGFSFIDEVVRRLTGANLRDREDEAEAELLRSIEDTHREGGLDERAVALLENVVEFSSTDVGEVMTPRTDIDGLELTDDLAAIRSFIIDVGHSRIPVYEENLDNVVGILHVKDLVSYLGEDASAFKLKPILRQPILVPPTKPVRELLGDFQRSEVHMAMVVDEYGGTAGLVTIEDVLEEIVGEIQDEHDVEGDEQPVLERLDALRAEVDGRYHLDDLNEEMGLDLPEDEEFDTVAGFVLASLGHVPKAGESFELDGVRYTTLEATPRQVLRVGVEILEPALSNGERKRKP